jgi:hypothetical protein
MPRAGVGEQTAPRSQHKRVELQHVLVDATYLWTLLSASSNASHMPDDDGTHIWYV